MRVSYQNANPRSGHESYYIKFENRASTTTNCVLIDSGENVDVESDLGENEYLSAVLLTHAHADHYQTISDNVKDGAKVLMTPATASVLENVLSEASKRAETEDIDWKKIEDSVEPVTDWYSITADVEVRPVPAGHIPGACGYLIRFDGDKHILATGDFTFDRAAGYPQLPKEELEELGVDVLFLNASASEPGELTQSVEKVMEQAVSGGHVLVSASGMTCVKYVYILGHLIEEQGLGLRVSIAGQAAKIYEDLGYDVPNVSSYPVYESTDEVLKSDISVAGPEKPTEGSSEKLFEEIKDDGSATLVRVLGASTRAKESAGCTVNDYETVNHPTQEKLYNFVEELNPVHTVIQHGNTERWDGERFRFTMTWSDNKTEHRVLYSDGDWRPPGWLDEGTLERILKNNRSRGKPDISSVMSGDGIEEMLEPDFPKIEPQNDEVKLNEEGILIDEIRDREFVSTSEPVKDTEKAEESTEDESVSEEGEKDLHEIRETLERIEEKVDAETHEAVVVDTGGGDLLLRLEGKDIDDLSLEHGESVEVSVFER
mgnify:CR=1 FL=1